MGQVIAFWVFAAAIIGAALGVVLLKNVFRSAVLLIACFFGVAGIFILLSADFLAAMQILIYIGAISILVILAIMLTREVAFGSPDDLQVLELHSVSSAAPGATTTSGLGVKLFSKDGFILPVEILPTVLLATILGAIVLVKDRKK